MEKYFVKRDDNGKIIDTIVCDDNLVKHISKDFEEIDEAVFRKEFMSEPDQNKIE